MSVFSDSNDISVITVQCCERLCHERDKGKAQQLLLGMYAI